MNIGKKGLSIIAIGTTLIGMAVTVVSNWVGDRKMEETIKEEVNKALAERETKGEEL